MRTQTALTLLLGLLQSPRSAPGANISDPSAPVLINDGDVSLCFTGSLQYLNVRNERMPEVATCLSLGPAPQSLLSTLGLSGRQSPSASTEGLALWCSAPAPGSQASERYLWPQRLSETAVAVLCLQCSVQSASVVPAPSLGPTRQQCPKLDHFESITVGVILECVAPDLVVRPFRDSVSNQKRFSVSSSCLNQQGWFLLLASRSPVR